MQYLLLVHDSYAFAEASQFLFYTYIDCLVEFHKKHKFYIMTVVW
jgi:hypothetical protein